MVGIREFSKNSIGDNATIIQGDFNATFNTNLNDEESEQNKLFLEKISKTDPLYDKKRIVELKGPFLHESFEWILNHEDFRRWRNTEESDILWIKGDPGKGKTMLLCGIVDDLEKNPGINSNFGYFFCQATDDRINTAVAAVGGLIYSFFESRQKLLGELLLSIRKKFEKKLSQLSGPNAWQILSDIFETIIQDPSLPNIVCVVDALDECEHGIKLLLSLIVRTSGHVKWLFSSRNVKEIEQGLRSIDLSRRLVLELTRNAKCVSESVDAYIDHSTRDITALTDDEELRIKTTGTLKLKADGTFLWVSLVVEQLLDTNRWNIEEVLEELPVGLENLYDLIMKRIDQKLRKKNQDVCHILLSIVTTAERPLRLEELLEFIKFQWKDYKENYDVRDLKDMIRDCGSFLSVKDGTVYLVHQSVKEYMVGKGAETIFPSGVAYQHSEMFKSSLYSMSCILTYDIYHLKAPATDWDEIYQPYPDPLAPIAYCCVFWAEHLVQSCHFERTNVEELLKDNGTLHDFLKDKFLCWLEALSLLKAFTQGLHAIDKVKSIISRRYEYQSSQYEIEEMTYAPEGKKGGDFRVFIDDAWIFMKSCEEYVHTHPLQLYYAPFVFGNNNNTINKTFQQTIHAKFGDLPTLTIIPPRQFSYTLLISTISKKIMQIGCVLFSPDSSLLCVQQVDGTISLWETTSGNLKREIKLNVNKNSNMQGMQMQFPAYPGIDYYLSFSIDSSQITCISGKGVVQTWSIDDNSQMQRHHLQFMDEREKIIALSQDGDLATSVKAGDVGQLITIWATKTGEQTQTICPENTSNISSAAFSPNSELIALIDESGVAIYPIQTGEATCIQRLWRPLALFWVEQKHGNERLSKFSPNSETFAYVYHNCTIELWCTNTWTKLHQITQENVIWDKHINHFAFSPDSATFIFSTQYEIVLGSITTGQCQRYALRWVKSFSTSWSWMNSSWLLAVEKGYHVEIWLFNSEDAVTGAHNGDFLLRDILYISPDSKLIVASGGPNSDINIIDAESGEVAQVLKTEKTPWNKPAFSPGSYFLAGQVEDSLDILIWDINTGTVVQRLQNPGYGGTAVAFSHDSKYLATSYVNIYKSCDEPWERLVRIWHVESGHLLHEFGCGLHVKSINTIAISADLKFVAICGFSDEVQIWEPLAGHCVQNINQPFAIELKFSSNSKFLAVMHRQPDRVQIWDTASGVCLFSVETGFEDCVASFDPFKGDIVTDQFVYKTSTWKQWHQFPRRGYSYHGSWICFDGQETLFIPSNFKYGLGRRPVILDSLIAYSTRADQLMIIKFPDCRGLKGQETIMLGSCSSSHLDLNLKTTSNADAGYLIGESSGTNMTKKQRLD